MRTGRQSEGKKIYTGRTGVSPGYALFTVGHLLDPHPVPLKVAILCSEGRPSTPNLCFDLYVKNKQEDHA